MKTLIVAAAIAAGVAGASTAAFAQGYMYGPGHGDPAYGAGVYDYAGPSYAYGPGLYGYDFSPNHENARVDGPGRGNGIESQR